MGNLKVRTLIIGKMKVCILILALSNVRESQLFVMTTSTLRVLTRMTRRDFDQGPAMSSYACARAARSIILLYCVWNSLQ